MSVTVKIPTQLRPVTGGESEAAVEDATTVGEVLDGLYDRYDGLRDRIAVDGDLRRFVNVYVGGEDAACASRFASALTSHADEVEPYLARFATVDRQSFTALNTACLADGAFVVVPAGAIVERGCRFTPLFVSATEGHPTMTHPRVLVVMGAHSQATIVESYAGPYGDKVLHQRRHRDRAGRERGHRSREDSRKKAAQRITSPTRRCTQAAQQQLHHALLVAGGALVRNEVRVRFDGEHAEATVNGLYLADGKNSTSITSPSSITPSRTARAMSCTRASWTASARRLQRQDHRPQGRPEDRRQADEQGAAAVRRRDDQHQAAARDLRRRREVHARRDDRPARRGRDLLPARPRASRSTRPRGC